MAKPKTKTTSAKSSKPGKKIAKVKFIRLPLEESYPKFIYFSDSAYAVKFKKNLNCFGQTDPETKTITIKSNLSARQLFATFIHELIHVIEFDHPLRIKHSMVYELEKAIVEILLDNFM